MSETNTTLLEAEQTEDGSDFIQFITTLVSITCAFISLAAFFLHRIWRKHNHLYARQIVIASVATCWMLLIIIFTEEIEDPEDDFTMNDFLNIAYFTIVIMTVSGTVQTVALAHIYVALDCDEIADEDSCVALSWYYSIAATNIVLVNVKLLLDLDIQTALCIAGIVLSAVTTGNVMLLSRTVNGMERKCSLKITFIVFVISLGILSDVLLILYGGLLLTGSNAGGLNDLLKVACTAVILLKTVLILCNKDAMDWKNFRSSRQDRHEEVEMQC